MTNNKRSEWNNERIREEQRRRDREISRAEWNSDNAANMWPEAEDWDAELDRAEAVAANKANTVNNNPEGTTTTSR